MNGFETISDGIQIAQGDCLEVMKEIRDGSVDMVLCDLPYGTTSNTWDVIVPFESLWEQYARVCKENTAIVLFSQMPFTAELIASNPKWFRYEWIWRKPLGSNFLQAHKMPLKVHENILVFYAKLPQYNPQKTKGKPYIARHGQPSTNYNSVCEHVQTINESGDRFPVDILEFNWVNNQSKTHPTQKPVDLLRYFIRTYTSRGGGRARQHNGIRLDRCCGDFGGQRVYWDRTRGEVFQDRQRPHHSRNVAR